MPTVNKKQTKKKHLKILARNSSNNRIYRSSTKTAIKNCIRIIKETTNHEDIYPKLAYAFSKIDKSVKRNVIHKNTGARKKARIIKLFKTRLQKST